MGVKGSVKKRDEYKGYLMVFHTIQNITLFRLDSVKNVNTLLREFFENDKEMYKIIKSMFMSISHQAMMDLHDVSKFLKYVSRTETKTQPVQFQTLIRKSVLVNDIKFVNWLCKNGFGGYASDKISLHPELGEKKITEFGAEIVLCNPSTQVEFLDEIQISVPKSFQELNNALIEIQKKPIISQFMKKNNYI
jgi:hypothetical protein